MNHQYTEEQERLQAQAELAERQGLAASGNPALDSYRLVIRALHQPLSLQLPADFAAALAAWTVIPEESSRIEDWLMSLLMLVLAGAGLVYVQPVMASVLGQLDLRLPAIPWPLLGAAAASVVVAWALDRGAVGWSRHAHHG